jgi:hypothetical protein
MKLASLCLHTKALREALMNIFLYAKQMNGPGIKLRRALEVLVQGEEIEVFTTISDMAKRLYPFGHENRMVIFLASNREELLEIFSISNLLRRLRSILVLPDRSPDTLKLGYLLEPRFISYVDSGFFEIQAMIGQIRKKNPNGHLMVGRKDSGAEQDNRSCLVTGRLGVKAHTWSRAGIGLMAS